MFKKEIPEWVLNIDNPLVKDVLSSLCTQSKKPLNTPREIIFWIIEISSLKKAQNAVVYLEQQGWKCKIDHDETISKGFWMEATQDNYSIEESRLREDMDFFNRIAEMYDGYYDGFTAELV